jgi:glycosyltransferase involved in cell wall biosynthesis
MRRKVLLVQPSMQPPGGGNAVAAWMLQALVPDHDVTVLSWWPVETEPMNRFFGTSLDPGSFKTLVVPPWWRQAVGRLPVPAALLRGGLLMRYARRCVADYDVVLGAHNEMDYGRPGIQYIHYPTYWRPRPRVDFRWYHHITPLLHGYYAVADRLAGYSSDRMKANVTLANSDWTAGHIRRYLGIDAQTLYPPVVQADAPLPWHERRRAFLAIGRISPEKEFERVIRIIAAVRQQEPDITLTIVGTWDRATRRYYNSLRQLAAAVDPSRTLVSFRQNLSRAELRQLLASNRYGIHGMREEHFGMAPAEMVMAGMIVWVPNGGGQVEIVDRHPMLTYDSDDDAVGKIVRVLRDDQIAAQLREHLRTHARQFSIDTFVARFRELVANFHPTV